MVANTKKKKHRKTIKKELADLLVGLSDVAGEGEEKNPVNNQGKEH